MKLQESGEMYLETIYVLSEKNPIVRAIDVGEYMGYSKPSVSRAMSILKKGGFVKTDDFGALSLTDAGREVAETMYERHSLLSAFLSSIGVSSDTATEDACKIEHYISAETFDAIKEFVHKMEKEGK